MIGAVIGNYRVVAELGKGGMGVVYRAEHVQLGRSAALKMLLPQFSSDAGIVQRFFNEARAASAIDHPGIVEIYDFGTHTDGRAYIVMALLKGESLEARLKRGPIDPLEGATLIAQVAAALGAAHGSGIVHRDLKPDNVFLVANELVPGGLQVKLLDFGIAKLADEKQAGFKTQTGALMGTPAYMSPEQCMGRPDLDHRTDIYSVGCILFHVMCGRPPFISDQGTGMMIAAHIRDAAPDPRTLNPNVSAPLASVIMRCLEKEPAARFQSSAELRNALVGAGANAPLSRPPIADQYAATMPPSPREAVTSPFATAPTTHSQSAAQVMTPPVSTARGSQRTRVWLGVGALLAVIGGVGAVVAMSRGGKPAEVASQEPMLAPPTPAPPTPVLPTPEQPTPAPPPAPLDPTTRATATRATPTCPAGQLESADTNGHCCWPEQAWSSAKNRCIGKPACPSGTTARGEQCVEVVTITPPKPDPAATAPAGPVSFTLAASTVAPGATVDIKFATAMSSPSNHRAWVTIIEAGRPPTAYGTWDYVKDGATTATLKAPTHSGAYEVRLHTDYPTKATNLRHAVAFTVGGTQDTPELATDDAITPLAKQKFRLAATRIPAGGEAELRFPVPLRAAAGERFWVTVIEHDKDDSSYGHYDYVPAGVRSMKLTVPANAGDYDVRLHANYPTKSTNVVHRVRIRVETAP